MEITGKLINKLKKEAGTSKAGKPWIKQTCILETDSKYNNLVAIECFGEDKVKQMNKLDVGMIVTISCNVYSKEYNGRYYNHIDGWFFTDQSNNPQKNNTFVTIDDNDNMPF